nr:MAG TPA: hypothetical protein [Caudoviricetes sp.]
MVDTAVLETVGFIRASSSLAFCTKIGRENVFNIYS